jgi:hypothetical protein
MACGGLNASNIRGQAQAIRVAAADACDSGFERFPTSVVDEM